MLISYDKFGPLAEGRKYLLSVPWTVKYARDIAEDAKEKWFQHLDEIQC
jgi:hypothetical protein